MTKRYEVRFGKRAQKTLKKEDPNNTKIIMSWIKKNLVGCEDPFALGKPLKGDLKDRWRYRLGDYRLICHIDDKKIIILILEVGHRRDIYRRK